MDDRTDADDLQATLAEQRRELLAAKTLDSDLDMAFNLQMQKALTASLVLKPSSSGTSQSPPPSPPYEPKDDLLDLAAAFMLEDVDRFPHEYDDHERTVLEVKKAKVDLDRRIHNHKFAIEVRDLPEDYWSEYGDEFERPYCTDGSSSSSSSSKAAVETECLRLYCKGLISEELVKNVKVAVAGIGVAICDPRYNLIFEVKEKFGSRCNSNLNTRKNMTYDTVVKEPIFASQYVFALCGFEFCYTCGAEWKNEKPTCSCPIWDERNIIHEQPREVQVIIDEQPRHVRPIIHEQPRQLRPRR